ncbi:hypothetical protein Patl1_24306 [Pistacia atlantica]|uniref:Uncharacterized protein n=1 Tax=Pistacia atlantica TaxID=434234 RepID=A0ACC0ZWV4_9ROSI|nr:hypothetical protein Patl1_24306 [Pistacia atlantica]
MAIEGKNARGAKKAIVALRSKWRKQGKEGNMQLVNNLNANKKEKGRRGEEDGPRRDASGSSSDRLGIAAHEIMNLRNLERVLAREEEDKKRAIVHKAVHSGPQMRLVWLPTSPAELHPGKAVCAVTELPARYRDPKTGLPCATKVAFKIIRERFVDENIGVPKEMDMGTFFDSLSEKDSVPRQRRFLIGFGVLLLNLGGPKTLQDVQPFLFNLFADPDIIRLPRLYRFLQWPLAKLISVLLAPKSKEGYASIGGGLPLRKITNKQNKAIKQQLKMALEVKNLPVNVYVGVRFRGTELQGSLCCRFIQSSLSLQLGRAFVFLKEYLGKTHIYQGRMFLLYGPGINEKVILNELSTTCLWLLYVELQNLKDRGVGNDHTLEYQPYTDEVLVELGRKGVKSLLAVPVSFVSEHVETLEEIGMEYRELSLESGIQNWGRVPALN